MTDPQAGYRGRLTCAQVDGAVAAVRKAATEAGLNVTTAVVDEAAVLRAFHRMDGASLISVELSLGKARTASSTGRATHRWADLLRDDDDLRRQATTSMPGLVLFGGGLPIKDRTGALIGGLGVSGASQEQDLELAKAGLAAIEFLERSAS